MKIGLQLCGFPDAAAGVAAGLADVARAADESGFASLWVMDHFFQIPPVGPAEEPMLSGYPALAYLAAVTSRVQLGTLVTGVTYRHPGLLAKDVTTLDVLSGGRAVFGIGAAWFEREHAGLGVPMPPLAERFELLEEALQIALQMWGDDDGPYEGAHYNLAETLNVPQSLQRPHPPVLVGGMGEKKTLRLVARYADACNVFAIGPAEVGRKFDVLRRHCEAEGRDFDAVERTMLYIPPGPLGATVVPKMVEDLRAYADVGVQHAIVSAVTLDVADGVRAVGEEVVPAVADL